MPIIPHFLFSFLVNAMELRLVAGECKDRRDPLALFFLDILGSADTSLHLYLGEGGFP